MLEGAFSFQGRIGRLNYFLASLLVVPVAVVAILVVTVLMAAAHRSPASLLFFGVCMILLAIAMLWYSLSLQVRRIRDIGWSPFYVLVGWFIVQCADAVLAVQMPSMAIGHAHHSTVIGAVVNLAMTLALWFWPSTDGNVGGGSTMPDVSRMSRVEALGASAARFDAPAPVALARLPSGAPREFGRRGVR